METAIKIAIENGWKPNWGFAKAELIQVRPNTVKFKQHSNKDGVSFAHPTRICLDPLFWQALGKGIGGFPQCACDPYEGTKCSQAGLSYHKENEWWFKQWHLFIDHLAEGKDIDSFFTNLTK